MDLIYCLNFIHGEGVLAQERASVCSTSETMKTLKIALLSIFGFGFVAMHTSPQEIIVSRA
ncbi:MAG: hypothetical protein CMI26_03240 [Opitutae bacterium]|nr:hypothetical protein [Opitutae bacterium]